MSYSNINIQILTATLEHVEHVTDLFIKYRTFYKMPPDEVNSKKFLTDRITNNESVIFLVKVNDNFAGFVQLYPIFSSTRLQKHWLLNDLFVDENYRRLGLAEMLIERSKDLAKETNARGLILETASDNNQAQSLYLKTGFQKDNDHFYFHWDNE